ncbi:MAG: triple tyrosine motif-containing protein, partial [Saprospiraceae bacterium]
MRQIIHSAIFLLIRLIGLTILLPFSGWTQVAAPQADAQISTRLFNARDGLPDNKVFQFLETRKSPFRWAVTRNELCRFDGYRFQTVWEKMPDIDGFAENSSGEIVVWSHLNSQKISVFKPNSGQKESRSIAEIPGLKGRLVGIWAQDTMLFLTMHPEMGKKLAIFRLFPGFLVQNLLQVDLHFDNAGGTLPLDFLSSFFFDEKNQAICYSGQTIGQNNAVFRYDLHTEATTKFHLTPNDGLYHTWIFSSLPDGSPMIYSTYENGLWRWNEPSKNFEKINHKPSAFVGLHCIGTDQKGAMIFQKKDRGLEDLWLLRPDGSWLDLQKLMPKLNYRTCSGADFSRQIHFCTLEGVLRVNFERPLFSNFFPPKTDILNIHNNAFRGITADRDGNVWMMGEMISLFCRRPDGSTDRVAVREKNSGLEIQTDNALNLQTDGQGKIWSAREVGTAHNLLRIDPKTGLADTFVFKNQRITTFTILKNGGVLLAANNEKQAFLLLLNPETRQVLTFGNSGDAENFKTSSIFLLENPEGKIWAGGKSGLSLFDISTKKWADFSGNDTTAREFPVSVIFQEKETLWVGTLGGGLRKLDLQSGKWEVFTMANGLPANKIAGILPDDAGNLWVSTYNGLSFFQSEAKLFTNFFAANGLAHNEFNRFSFFKTADGRMFFGGLSGVSFFKPLEVLASFSQGSDSLLISQISWFAPDGKTRVEQIFDFENLEKITLPADNRFCSIRLALANYLQPEANRFAWKLEGYDADWHLNGTNNEIAFHYLPAGKYRLRIKAANPTGVWGKTERVIQIEVREFWYKTWWAFGLFAGAIVALFFLYYRYKVNQKLEHAETQRIKELDHLKTRLYTNITHEFRTPLTVILGMADEIEGLDSKQAGPISSAVGLIRRNGKNLLRLINQLLDLSKLDSGQMKLQFVQADIIGYLQYLTESFYSMSQEKKVRLIFYPETPELVMDFDEEKIQVIVYNLLSNALKFTGEGRKVVLHAAKIEQNSAPFLQLKVQDTGVGIAEKELPHIFDRFYQADNSSTRKGEGT